MNLLAGSQDRFYKGFITIYCNQTMFKNSVILFPLLFTAGSGTEDQNYLF